MPEPNPQGWNPPAGDAAFDSLFQELEPTTPHASTPAPTQPQAPVEQQPQAQPTPPQATFELKNASGSVNYKSADEAIRGIESKDATINQLRNTVIAMTGYDPLTKQPSQSQPISYLSSPDRYAKDLTEAAEEGSRTGRFDKYGQVQARFVGEIIQSQIAPYVPNVLQAGRQNAINRMAQAVPDFPTFYGSAEYEQTLEATPALRRAIATAEQTPDYQAELPELYKLAYEVRQAAKLREQIKSGNAAPPNQPARPTLQPTTLTPPSSPSPQARPTLATSEGRKAIIAGAESKGVLDTTF